MKKKQEEEISLEGKTREQKKVIIAEDVIANIIVGKYIAMRGAYIDEVQYETVGSDAQVKENWDKLKSCQVCGIGACLLSITKFNNKLSFAELPGSRHQFREKHLELLTEIFTAEELAVIEVMFEQNWDWGVDNIGRDKLGYEGDNDKMSEYENLYLLTSNEKRLIAIMNRIIDSGGQVL